MFIDAQTAGFFPGTCEVQKNCDTEWFIRTGAVTSERREAPDVERRVKKNIFKKEKKGLKRIKLAQAWRFFVDLGNYPFILW